MRFNPKTETILDCQEEIALAADREGFKRLVCFLGGGALGALLLKKHYDEGRKSAAEKEDPEGVEWICSLIGKLLEDWTPRGYETEDEYTEDLFRYLQRTIRDEPGGDDEDVTLEIQPGTPHGVPDILINDRLVLELKVNPDKSERDRLVGQCSGYSREWVTWTILIDTPAHRVRELEVLLESKNMNYIEVIPFE